MDVHCPGHEKRSQLLDEAVRAVLSSVDMHVVVERAASLLRDHFGTTRLSIHRCVDDAAGTLEVLLVDDPRHAGSDPVRVGARIPIEGSASGAAVTSRRPFVVEDLATRRTGLREEKDLAPLGYGALVSFPLIFEDRVLGTLEIVHAPREGLLDCCMETAGRVAALLAIALHNSLMVEEVRRLNRLLGRENTLLKEQIRQARGESRYIAESARMREVLDKVKLVAPSETTVLIRGETGTGKEGLARMVHELSPRFGGPFVVVNLGAIPETLIESELFGYEKGAFTGAIRRKLGRFEQAEEGTIFLDEVGDAPPAVQVRLLRVLQEKEVVRVGGDEGVKVDVRVVAATNRNLERMVESGAFRQDLYYRLNVFPIRLPPLREHREDLRALGAYFLSRLSARMHRKPPVVPEAAWRRLEAYDWPGNVRELENLIERALILSPGDELVVPSVGAVEQAPPPSASGAAAASGASVPTFDDAMRDLLGRALEAASGRIYGPGGAADLLRLKPTTLQGKLRKYGLKGD
jgi:formate hydrogenlyase transcriptional activator